MTARGLRSLLADGYGPALAAVDPTDLAPDVRGALAELLLLSGDTSAAAAAAGDTPGTRLATLLAVGGAPIETATQADAVPTDSLAAAALAAFGAQNGADARSGERGAQLSILLDSGRVGDAVLGALGLLQGGAAIDPATFGAALGVLVRAGQAPMAHRIAVETLLAQETH